MSDVQETQLVSVEQVEKLIHLARGEKVVLDADLARLYGVEHGVYALHHSHRTALHTSLRLAPPYVEAT
jgi:hypothetical protein